MCSDSLRVCKKRVRKQQRDVVFFYKETVRLVIGVGAKSAVKIPQGDCSQLAQKLRQSATQELNDSYGKTVPEYVLLKAH